MTDSRRKGADGERELAALLRDELGDIVTRTGFQQADSGGFDLLLPNCGIEVKRHKRPTDAKIEEWWQQTKESWEEFGGTVGVLAFRGDKQCWRFTKPQTADDPGGYGRPLVMTWRLDHSETLYLPRFCYWYRENCL